MTIIHAILLAVIEGLTEFLPVSSTGHLILAAHLLSLPETEFQKSFEIIIQLGAIGAVMVLYAKKMLTNIQAWKKIGAAFIPSAIISFALYKIVKTFFLGNTQIVIWSLFIGGIIIILFDKFYKQNETPEEEVHIENISYRNAVLIGLFQTLAIIPGVSRSAATIIGALWLKETKKTAVEFSFLLAVPTMIAASGYDFLKTHAAFNSSEYGLLAIGFIGAFITALIAVKIFLEYIQKHSFSSFGVYRIIVAIVYFIFVK